MHITGYSIVLCPMGMLMIDRQSRLMSLYLLLCEG